MGTDLIEPRRWQEEALGAWQAAGQQGIVNVVTGAGKTLLAILAIRATLAEGWRYVVICPTIALVDQWYVSLVEDAGIPADDISTIHSRTKRQAIGRFILVTMASARQIDQMIGADPNTMLIVDEVHGIASPRNSQALATPHAAALGLSATPYRQYDNALEESVVPFIGAVIYTYDMASAIRDGVLVPVDRINVRVPFLTDEQKKYDQLSVRLHILLDEGRREDEIVRVARQRSSVAKAASLRVPVAVRILENHRGERALVFHEQIDAANRLAELLRLREHSVAVYHSQLSESHRRDNLRLYRRGVFDTLVSCRALDEGVNIPETRVAVVASATASDRQRIQRLGRVLRPSIGKTRATVYTLYATEVEERRLRREASAADTDAVMWQESSVRSV